MDELPERLDCPELELLLFGIEKNPHLRIPDSFFEMARKLRVLDFRGLRCLSLPRSLGFLSSLYTLCLHGCQLGDTAFIGELKSLEILSFRGSEVRQLPREIGQLTRLKILDLSECYHLKVIPANVMSRLSMLEELYMGDCFNIQWEVEGISNPSNASLAELRNLSLLKILEILVPDAKMLPEDLFRNYKLEKYNICIGAEALERKKISIGASWYYSLYETSRTLKLKLETNSHLEHGIGAMLKEAEHLSLDVSEGFKSMFYGPDWEGFPKLKNLSLANCHDIQYIINFVNQVPFDAFPALESLSLLDLMNLEKFCHGQLPTGSFSKLRILEVYGCYRLKNLFSFSMVRNLPEFQKMKVSDCAEMEEIVGGESGIKGDEVDEVAEFPELRCLRLSRLPLLVNFCSKLTSQTREEQLTLFNRRVLFPNLEELKVKAIGGEIRQDNEVSVVSSSYLKLKHLFLSSFVRSHERIKKLQISPCESIEGIVLTEEETVNNRLFASLESLTISDLPYLTRFSEGYLIEFCSLTKLSISNCPALKTFISNPISADVAINIERGALFDKKVEFPSLENLDIRCMDNLETTWDNQLGAGSFCKLKSLRIEDCKKLKNIFPSKDLGRFQRLEELRLEHCDSVEEVYQLQELNAEETSCVLAFDLRSLGVRGLTQLKYIWSKDPKGIFTFQNLRLVDVFECKVMKYVFPESIATDLTQLQSLSVRFSCGVEEIVGKAEGAETAPLFGFPQLLHLRLEYPREVKSFYPGICTSDNEEFLSGKMRSVASKFFIFQENHGDDEHLLIKKIFPKLENLAIDGLTLGMILQHRWSTALFSKVKYLNLWRVDHKLGVDLCGFLARLPNLENCSVKNSSLKELFRYEGHGRDKKDVAIVLQRIRNLDILHLPNLKHIWKQHPQLHFLLQHAETINVSCCDSLTNLAPSSASFQNLTTLQVRSCDGLLHLTTLSVAKSMEQLINMEIRDCERLTEIVADDGDGTTEEVVFPKLKILILFALESLTSFCLGSFTFNFPSLVEVTVERCPNMRTFSAGVLTTPKLHYVLLATGCFDWQGNLSATIQQMHQDGFRDIQYLKLSKFPQLKEKWNSQISFEFLSSVETLVVEKCEFFTRALSSNHLQFLEYLQKLVVEQCDSLEEIFDLEGLAADEGYVLHLWELELSHLPQLKSIWSKSPRGILSVESLHLLKIHNCSSLSNIFTLSTALPLVGLQYLEVKGCKLLVEIINKEGEKEAEYWDKPIFPSLHSIILESLPSLVSFYSGIHVLKCPTLKTIDVVNCPKMDIFVSTLPSNDESIMIVEGNKLEPREGPIFCGQVAIENLKEMKLEWVVLKEIWDGRFQEAFLHQLEVLELLCFPDECVALPSDFFHKLANLKKLVVDGDSLFEQLFQHELYIGEEEHARSISQLEVLKLSDLPILEHIVEEDSQPASPFKYLQILEVMRCSKLNLLVLSSLCFQNLTDLEVSKCNGMMNLISSSAARSLVRLTSMIMEDCNVMKEVVAGEDDGEVHDEIHFGQLEYLRLNSLPCLTSFCLGNYALNFPCLGHVVVTKCPKMKIFAQGVLSTPMLSRIYTRYGKYSFDPWDRGYRWEGSLNNTIQELFMETVDEEN